MYNRALTPDEIKRLYKIGSTFVVNKTRQDTLREGLVGHWSFDGPDMSQSTNNVWALDRSGQGNNGVLKNMATSTARKIGKLGQALSFDGVNDYTHINSPTGIPDLNGNKTYSAWIKYSSLPTGDNTIMMSRNTCCSAGIYLRVNSTDLVVSRIGDAETLVSTSNRPSANQWHHVLYTYDGTTNRLYVDGAEVANSATAPYAGATNVVYIGTWNETDNFWSGLIDEVRVYNRALAPDEINYLAAELRGMCNQNSRS